MSYPDILKVIAEEVRSEMGKGRVADYIPALARVPGDKFGIAVTTLDGEHFQLGDAEEQFLRRGWRICFLRGAAG